MRQAYGTTQVVLFTVKRSYLVGISVRQLELVFPNTTSVTLSMGGYYFCEYYRYKGLNAYKYTLPLLPKKINSLFFYLPYQYKKLNVDITWIGPGYTGTVYQNPLDYTSFRIQLITSPTLAMDTGADFNLTVNGNSIAHYIQSTSLKVWDQMIISETVESRDCYASTKRPYIPFLYSLEGDPRNVWFQDSGATGELFTDYFKGNPNTQTILLNTFMYSFLGQPQQTILILPYNGATPNTLEPASSVVYTMQKNLVSQLSLGPAPIDSTSTALNHLDFKFKLTSDAELSLTLSASLINDKSFPYPLGISGGNLKNCDYSFSFPVPLLLADKITISALYSELFTISTQLAPTPADTIPPIVHNLTITHLSGPYYLLSANITDNQSGFKCLLFNDELVLNSYDIVQGTLTDGIYETLIDKRYLLSITNIKTFDNALSSSIMVNGYYNAKGDRVASINDILVPTNISQFDFEKYNIDLSNSGSWNTLYFNYSRAGPYEKVIFYPIILVPKYSINDPSILKDPKYQYEYNQDLRLFKIDFYLPAGLYTQNITYYIGDLSGTLLHSDDIYRVVGPSALLSVYSQDANQMMPYFIDFQPMGSQTRTLEQTDAQTTIGWVFTIETLLYPLKYFNVTVTSDFNPQGKNYTFTGNDSINNDPQNGVYQLLFDVKGTSRSQEYKVSYAILEDTAGRKSGYNYPFLHDALFRFTNTSFLSIKVNTPAIILDTTGPVLDSYSLSASSFNPMAADRLVQILFRTRDVDSTISIEHVPVVYLTPVFYDSRYTCQTTIVSIASDKKTVSYKAICEPPFGFAYPDGFSISLYGLVDEYFNVNGYSSSTIFQLGLRSFVPILQSTYYPILDKIDFNENGHGNGPLILTGRGFGSGFVKIDIRYKGEINWNEVNVESFNYYTGVQFSFNYSTLFSFSIRVRNSGNIASNILDFEVIINSSESNSISSSSNGNSNNGNGDGSSNETSSSNSKATCPSNCGGPSKGICLSSGGCKCFDNYYGEDCTSQIIVVPLPDIDPNTPTTTIVVPNSDDKIKVSSLISIIAYNELDSNGKVVKHQTFKQWFYSEIRSGLYLYRTNIEKTNVNVTIEYFTNTTTIQFAGQVLTMNPSSIKYQISIDKYQFESTLNQLEFIMSASINMSNNDGCTYNNNDNTIEGSEYLRLQIDNYSLYGRFIKRGLVDNRPRNIINTFINSNTTKNSEATKQIGIRIPFYNTNAIIDPDFSILIDSNSAKDREGSICSSKSKKLTGPQIAGIVIGCVGFTAVIVTAVVYSIYKTKKSKQFEMKLHTISK